MKMKNQNVVFCVALVLGFVGVSTNPARSDVKQPTLSIKMLLNRDRFLPFESIGIGVEVSNKSANAISISNSSFGVGILVRKEGTKSWIGPGKGGGSYEPPPGTNLIKSGESINEYSNVGVNWDGYHVFEHPGVYYVKARFGNVETAIRRVVVEYPKADDVSALQSIRAKKLYNYFDPEVVLQYAIERKPIPSNAVEQLRMFSVKYSKSRYSYWAKLGELYIEEIPLLFSAIETGSINISERTRLLALEKRFVSLSTKAFFPIKSAALYEAGVIMALIKKEGESRVYFQKAVQIDPTLEYRRKKLFKVAYSALTNDKPTLVPQNILTTTIEDLESKGYDVKNFSRDYPKEEKEYSLATFALYAKWKRGEISEEKYYRTISRLLKEYVTKYAHPSKPIIR